MYSPQNMHIHRIFDRVLDFLKLTLTFVIRPLVGLLNNNTAELSSPWSMGVEHICNKARCI